MFICFFRWIQPTHLLGISLAMGFGCGAFAIGPTNPCELLLASKRVTLLAAADAQVKRLNLDRVKLAKMLSMSRADPVLATGPFRGGTLLLSWAVLFPPMQPLLVLFRKPISESNPVAEVGEVRVAKEEVQLAFYEALAGANSIRSELFRLDIGHGLKSKHRQLASEPIEVSPAVLMKLWVKHSLTIADLRLLFETIDVSTITWHPDTHDFRLEIPVRDQPGRELFVAIHQVKNSLSLKTAYLRNRRHTP